MRISFINQKGGVGKSTAALLLAGILKKNGYDVEIDDRDPQGTAGYFAKVFDVPLLENGHNPAYIVTDTPGHIALKGEAERRLIELIKDSDVLVLITHKTPMAIHGTAPAARLIKQHKRPSAKAYVLFNQVDSRSTIGQQSGAELARELKLPALAAEIPQYTAYQNACAVGLSAVTGKYRHHILTLALELLK